MYSVTAKKNCECKLNTRKHICTHIHTHTNTHIHKHKLAYMYEFKKNYLTLYNKDNVSSGNHRLPKKKKKKGAQCLV